MFIYVYYLPVMINMTSGCLEYPRNSNGWNISEFSEYCFPECNTEIPKYRIRSVCIYICIYIP
jgi:hypothetical protein